MNELREKMARAIRDAQGEVDIWMIGYTSRMSNVAADAALRAIEEAGYVVVPAALLKAVDNPPMSGVEKRLIECEPELSKPRSERIADEMHWLDRIWGKNGEKLK